MEPTGCETKWSGVHESFERQQDSLLEVNPDAAQEIIITRSTLIKIEELVQTSPK
jgi:hypothetical protein